MPKDRIRKTSTRMQALAKQHTAKQGEVDNRELQDLLESMGMRMVPITDLTPLEQLENRLDRMIARADEAFNAGKDASLDIKKFSEVFIPLLNDIKKEFGKLQQRQFETEQRVLVIEKWKDITDQRIAALEASTKKAG